MTEVEIAKTILEQRNRMTITEYFCRMCAAGLMPEWENIWYRCGEIKDGSNCCNTYNSMEVCKYLNVEKPDDAFQLRKDGVNLYKLEWRKPDVEDVGKMCWFWRPNTIILDYLLGITLDEELNLVYYDRLNEFVVNHSYDYCLLADHGQLAPTEQDFIKVYNTK